MKEGYLEKLARRFNYLHIWLNNEGRFCIEAFSHSGGWWGEGWGDTIGGATEDLADQVAFADDPLKEV